MCCRAEALDALALDALGGEKTTGPMHKTQIAALAGTGLKIVLGIRKGCDHRSEVQPCRACRLLYTHYPR